MAERGVIRNLAYTRQRADFRGLRFGTITPTDIDGLIEFEGRCCIFMETKHGDTDLPRGQRLALERNCDRWGENGIVLVMRNATTGNAGPTYNIASLPVVEYRYAGAWRAADGSQNCRQAIEGFATKRLGRPICANEPEHQPARAPVAVAPGNELRQTIDTDPTKGFGIEAYNW